ncbi:MAG: hypothetical protein LBB08_00380 [Rickettsiales bacterium]|jgi:hypothetical protein|nr:hypothetical protein [Rickettsiales bacterium]
MKKFGLFLSAAMLARAGAAAIDNVANYSSNPFYSSNSPYNQRFPTPVYAKGPAIGAAECQSAVASAIWTQCSLRNNCLNLAANDILSAVVLDLSNRTGANYATSCVGYIENAFNQYKQSAASTVYQNNFPAATKPSGFSITPAAPQNPYNYAAVTPKYEQVQDARAAQLAALQYQTGGTAGLTASAMPSTFEDLSFTERMDALREGWQDPSVGKSSFKQIEIESDEDMFTRQKKESDAQKEAIEAQMGVATAKVDAQAQEVSNNFKKLALEKQNNIRKSVSDWCNVDANKWACMDKDKLYERYVDIALYPNFCVKHPRQCFEDKAFVEWVMSGNESDSNLTAKKLFPGTYAAEQASKAEEEEEKQRKREREDAELQMKRDEINARIANEGSRTETNAEAMLERARTGTTGQNAPYNQPGATADQSVEERFNQMQIVLEQIL